MPEDPDCEIPKLRDKVHALEITVARLEEREAAASAALVIATKALDRQQTASNEWRQENIDQRALYMTEDKTRGLFTAQDAARGNLELRVNALEKSADSGAGRHSAFSDVWVKFVAVAALLMSFVSMYKALTGK